MLSILTNSYFIMAVAILFLIGLSAKGIISNIGKVSANNYVNKEHTDWLRGIAIIMVMYSHYFGGLQLPFYYCVIGTIGVVMFFFMSGLGLMSSRMRKKDYNKNFLSKKLLRLYSPVIVTSAICLLSFLIMGWEIVPKYFTDIIILSLPGSLNWYLKVQLIMYVVFWLLSLFIADNKKFTIVITSLNLLCIIVGVPFFPDLGMWYEGTLFFSIGIIMAMYKEKIYNILTKKYWLSLIIAIFMCLLGFASYYYIGSNVIYEMAYIYTFTALVLVAMLKIKGNSKILTFLGKHSIELYLSHTLLLKFVGFFDMNNILFLVCFVTASVLLAVGVKYLSNKLTMLIESIFGKLKFKKV